jgi:hypothetical protein
MVNMGFEGVLWRAFQRFCARKGALDSREGVRELIRETPEFRQLEAALTETRKEIVENGPGNNGGH